MEIYFFWDKQNDELEILGEDGEFYFYGEDSVEIAQSNGERGRYWTKLNKMQDVTPLNNTTKFDVLDPQTGEWIFWNEARMELVRQIHFVAGDADWRDVM